MNNPKAAFELFSTTASGGEVVCFAANPLEVIHRNGCDGFSFVLTERHDPCELRNVNILAYIAGFFLGTLSIFGDGKPGRSIRGHMWNYLGDYDAL